MSTIAIIIYSCIATADFSDYDPVTNYGMRYAQTHPQTCSEETEQIFTQDVFVEKCQYFNVISFQLGWMQRPENADRYWMGAKCELR